MVRGTKIAGFKGLGIDVKQGWSRVLQKGSSLVAGVRLFTRRLPRQPRSLSVPLETWRIRQ